MHATDDKLMQHSSRTVKSTAVCRHRVGGLNGILTLIWIVETGCVDANCTTLPYNDDYINAICVCPRIPTPDTEIHDVRRT